MGAIPLPDPVRRLSVPPLAGLEGQGCGSLGGGGSEVWLPHSLPQRTSTIQGSHPYAILPPLVHQRDGAWGGHSGSDRQECCGACSTSLPRLLQPSLLGVEDLWVVETRHRSLDPQSLRGRVTFQDGEHPVCSPVCSSGRLDGLHRSQGDVPTDSCPPRISSLRSICGSWPSVPIHCSVLASPRLRRSNPGSWLLLPPFSILWGIRMRRYLDDWPLSGAGHRGQPREVTPRTLSGCSVSRGVDRCPVFQGFPVAGSNRQAAINSWRISVLRRSSSQYLALAAGNAVLPLPSCSGRLSQGEISPAVSPPVLGSSGSVHPDHLVSGLPQGSQVVASRSQSIVRGVSSAGVLGSGLLVRCLGRRLQSSLGLAHRFRPLEPRRTSSLHQRQGTFSSSQGSPPLPVISTGEDHFGVLRQQHSSVLPPQGRRHEVPSLSSLPQGILCWAESLSIRLTPQSIPGSLNVLADSLSCPHQLPHTEWSLNTEVFRSISSLWPVQIDLFATSENRQCSIFFSPFRDPMAVGTDAFLQPWDGLKAYAFPPWSIIPRVLTKLRESRGGQSSPWWLRFGLSDPGFPTSFTCRWPPRLLCLFVQTSCACLDLAAFTRVSTGCVFMPGDSPALHESCRVLFHCSLPGFLVADAHLAQGLATQVASLQGLVPLSQSLGLSTFTV